MIKQTAAFLCHSFLCSCLEGTLSLLQYVYGDIYNNLTASFFKQETKGEDDLTDHLGNLTCHLDGFFQNVSNLPQGNISNPNIVLPLLCKLLEPTGLSSLLPLFLSDTPLNVSTVLDIASKIGSVSQPIFTSNETDPTMLELEQLIMQFLSLEGNLTLPLSHVMGYSLLNYSENFHLDDVTRFREAVQPFTNKTSVGHIDAILSAIELLKTVTDSPNGDPANITLGYIRQLQELVMSVLRLQKIEYVMLPNGKLSTAQVNKLSDDMINFLTAESLQNLTLAGRDTAQNIIIQKCVTFLPPGLQQETTRFLQDFRSLEYHISEYAASGQNWSTGISEIFTFLNQILDMVLSDNGNVTIKIPTNNSQVSEYQEIASMFFSLILSPNNDTSVETFNQTLNFISLIMATPNISVSEIQIALEQSNLTLDELNNIVAVAQAVNISDLLDNIMEIINASQCLEPQPDSVVTPECVMGLIDGITSILSQLPNFNETYILSPIPLVINRTIGDIFQVNSSSNPNMVLIQTLCSTLANIKMNLQLNQLNTPEIMNEIKVLEGLIQLFANMEPFDFNTTLMVDPMYAQKVYLEIVDWHLKRLENITSNSSISELLHPFFYLTQMQVTLQLAQTDFSSFVSDQVKMLMNSLQYPLNGAGVSKIGETVVEIVQHLFDLIHFDLEVQNTTLSSELFNKTILNATELHIRLYLDLIQTWVQQPNVSLALTSVLHWGNSSTNVSTHVTDIQQLSEILDNFLSDDQLAYLSIINNITQSLSNALMLAEQADGPQSDNFLDAILEVVENAVQILPGVTDPLPISTQKNILEIVRDSLELIVQPGLSFASSCNISLFILKTAESIIQHTVPDTFSEYLIYGLRLATTYFESPSTVDGPVNWNQM